VSSPRTHALGAEDTVGLAVHRQSVVCSSASSVRRREHDLVVKGGWLTGLCIDCQEIKRTAPSEYDITAAIEFHPAS